MIDEWKKLNEKNDYASYTQLEQLLFMHSARLLAVVEAAKLICKEYPPERDGMDGVILPVGIKSIRYALAALEAK